MQQESSVDWLLKLMDHPHAIEFAGMGLGALGIVAAAIVAIVVNRIWSSHIQRMAMIRQGMHPDGGYVEETASSESPPRAVSEKVARHEMV
jgi:hypothetical protein